jgi:ABC-type microcin C transport system permease subunit YejB
MDRNQLRRLVLPIQYTGFRIAVFLEEFRLVCLIGLVVLIMLGILCHHIGISDCSKATTANSSFEWRSSAVLMVGQALLKRLIAVQLEQCPTGLRLHFTRLHGGVQLFVQLYYLCY